MPYYVIDKYPVFLTRKKYGILREEALKDKDLMFKMKSTMKSNYHKVKENEEAKSLMYDMLKSEYDNNEENFMFKWVYFDMNGEEGKENIWNLLSDYCTYYGHSYLEEIRDLSSSMIRDILGESYKYPMGELFLLVHEVKPVQWYWKYTAKMKNRYIRAIIDTKRVTSISGVLKEFKIEFDNGGYIIFSENIVIAI
ncbi:hypothetical protein [Gudongella sp. DL1XJH-153]|uniref:hypothetical protein n=1 Tax=Gudongella sp. DL1XJH-153 TaxID=3409804 RepID=UPI003BB7D093